MVCRAHVAVGLEVVATGANDIPYHAWLLLQQCMQAPVRADDPLAGAA